MHMYLYTYIYIYIYTHTNIYTLHTYGGQCGGGHQASPARAHCARHDPTTTTTTTTTNNYKPLSTSQHFRGRSAY